MPRKKNVPGGLRYRKTIDNLLLELAESMTVIDSDRFMGLHYALDENSVYIFTNTQAINIYKSQLPHFLEELLQISKTYCEEERVSHA